MNHLGWDPSEGLFLTTNRSVLYREADLSTLRSLWYRLLFALRIWR